MTDGGGGFDVAAVGHACPDPLAPSGRGLYLIHALMDDVTIVCESGTTVTMWKRSVAAARRDEEREGRLARPGRYRARASDPIGSHGGSTVGSVASALRSRGDRYFSSTTTSNMYSSNQRSDITK